MNEKTVKKQQSRTSAERSRERMQFRDEDGNKFSFFSFLASLTLVAPRPEYLEVPGPV